MAMMRWGDWGVHWGWMWLVWALFIGVVVWATVRLTTNRHGSSDDRARAILDERYARGEIDDEEYRRRRRELDR